MIMIAIFLIISRLNSADALSCPSGDMTGIPDSQKVTLKVFVEHHQQALTSASSFLKVITSSESYRNSYNSLDTTADVSGSYKLFSASASATYSEVTSLITNQKEYSHRVEGSTRTYNPNYLQISREVTTTITIDGRTGKVFEKRYVDTTPTRWTRERLTEESVKYLRNKFYGEDRNIRGTTYTEETCIRKAPCTKEKFETIIKREYNRGGNILTLIGAPNAEYLKCGKEIEKNGGNIDQIFRFLADKENW